MRLNRKLIWLAMWTGVLLLGAGCSGVNASHSVSPIDFLLPGASQLFHLQYTPPQNGSGTNTTVAALQPSTGLSVTPQ
jgi:hypothetical protein